MRRMAGVVRFRSDDIGKGSFHPPEVEDATEGERKRGTRRHREDRSRRGAPEQRPSESVDDPDHRVEAVDRPPRGRNQAARVHDRRGEQPQLREKWQHVPNVPVLDVEGRQPESHAQRRDERQQHERNHDQGLEPGHDAVPRHHPDEQQECDGEVDQACEHGRKRNRESRKIHFRDQLPAADNARGRFIDTEGEEGPRHEPRQIEDRVGKAIRCHPGEPPEEEAEHEHGEQRLQHSPRHPECRLLVPDLDVTPDEEEQELAIRPQLAEAQGGPAARWVDDGQLRGARRRWCRAGRCVGGMSAGSRHVRSGVRAGTGTGNARENSPSLSRVRHPPGRRCLACGVKNGAPASRTGAHSPAPIGQVPRLYTFYMKFAPEYVNYVLNDNFEDAKALFLSPLMAIHHAHLVMLAETDIVSREDAHRIREALDGVSLDEVRDVRFDGTCEDLFFYVEGLLVASCGDEIAGRLHTARSRNDIDMTMYRMRQREFVLDLVEGVLTLRASLLDLASQHRDTIMAAHTHTQPAQPSTIAHYLLAMIEQLERDSTRLRASYQTTNRNPLGACAITGTGFPIDRSLTSELLGFDGATGNTYGSIATVDYLLESTYATAITLAGLGRFVQDLLPSGRRTRSGWRCTTRRSATSWTRKTTCSRWCGRCSGTPPVRCAWSPPPCRRPRSTPRGSRRVRVR